MQITEVKVFPIHEDKLKAFVSIVFDGCFMVNDIKVIRGKDGMFISMPSRRKKNGEFKDVAHPLNSDTRREIEERVLDEYERLLGERGEAPEANRRALGAGEGEAGEVRESRGSEGERDESGKSLEEIEEIHLRDSFWSVG
jgi:stage V sporulation protein G